MKDFLQSIDWVRTSLIAILSSVGVFIAGTFFLGAIVVVAALPYLVFLIALFFLWVIWAIAHLIKKRNRIVNENPEVTIIQKKLGRTVFTGLLLGIIVLPFVGTTALRLTGYDDYGERMVNGGDIYSTVPGSDSYVEPEWCFDDNYTDGVRIADVHKFAEALNQYLATHATYPTSLADLSPYISPVPHDACASITLFDYRNYFYDQTENGKGFELGVNLKEQEPGAPWDDLDYPVVSGGNLTQGDDNAGCKGEVGYRCYNITGQYIKEFPEAF